MILGQWLAEKQRKGNRESLPSERGYIAFRSVIALFGELILIEYLLLSYSMRIRYELLPWQWNEIGALLKTLARCWTMVTKGKTPPLITTRYMQAPAQLTKKLVSCILIGPHSLFLGQLAGTAMCFFYLTIYLLKCSDSVLRCVTFSRLCQLSGGIEEIGSSALPEAGDIRPASEASALGATGFISSDMSPAS